MGKFLLMIFHILAVVVIKKSTGFTEYKLKAKVSYCGFTNYCYQLNSND